MSEKFPVQFLAEWYQAQARDLPWRRSRTPYAVWISEMMLQQTQVATVIPYFQKFLARFPSIAALAAAEEEEVLSLWSGLGYYSRARNLHRAAQKMVTDFSGQVPKTRDEILTLPGVGPYSAGAILSIAYDAVEPIVDGNVRRVLSRWGKITDVPATWALAQNIVSEAERQKIAPSQINQALMELGALVCLPKAPLCLACPLAQSCCARAQGDIEKFPPAKPKPEVLRKFFAAIILEKDRKFWLRRRAADEAWLPGLWEFPMVELASATEAPHKKFAQALGVAVKVKSLAPAGEVRHTITRHHLSIALFSTAELEPKNPWGAWKRLGDIPKLSTSSILNKILRHYLSS